MLAVINVFLDSDHDPEELFVAHARWLTLPTKNPWMTDVGPSFCRLIVSKWRTAIARPATLCNPTVSVPAIRHACEEPGSSIAKAARILLAAGAAVRSHLSPEIEAAVRSL